MLNLLKVDFKRIAKDKLLIVMGILAVVFALMQLMIGLLFIVLDIPLDELSTDFINAKMFFFSSFSLSNNFGLIMPVLLSIIICKDYRHGTIRNKIISGNSRSSIYLSSFIVCTVYLCAIILLHAIITLLVSLIFFKYQATAFTFNDFIYLLTSVAFEMLVFIFISAFICFLCNSINNAGIVVLVYISVAIVFSMISAFLTAINNIQLLFDNKLITQLTEVLQRINIFNFSSYIGTGVKYSVKDILLLIIIPIIETASFLGLGFWSFKKKDIK